MPRSAAVVVLSLLVVLAGCGAGETPGNSTASPTATVDGTLAVHFLNVGQSASTLVVGPTGETMLVDSGGFQDDGEEVLAYLDRLGVSRVDYLVTSHADADHIGGHAAVIEHFETAGDGVGAVYDPGIPATTRTYTEYLDAVERHDVTLFETRAGDAIPMAGATVRVLAPPADRLAGGERNENSLVLLVEFGATTVLLTGDAGPAEEEYLVRNHGDALGATVLKAGHHGSGTSTGTELLDAAAPRVVAISSAYESQFGHPDEALLDRLANRSVPAYWTAVHGNVAFESDGTTVTVLTQRAATTDPRSLRSAPAVAPGTTDPLVARATVEGAGPPEAAATATPVPDDGTAASLALAAVHDDAAGDDRSNLNDEYVVLRNDGDATLDLSGWTVSDAAGRTYDVPAGTSLAPGASVRLHTGAGEDTATDLYWGAASPVWNNGGDTVTVRADDGTVVLEEDY